MTDASVAQPLFELIGIGLRALTGDRDLSLTATSTLSTLDRLGPQRLTALAAHEGVSQPSMTQLVQRLELRGMVTRTSDPSDGRVAVVSMTDEGHEALTARRQESAQRIAALLADLPAAHADALGAAVTAVLPALRRKVDDSEPARLANAGTGS